jgi:hypothetical protein
VPPPPACTGAIGEAGAETLGVESGAGTVTLPPDPVAMSVAVDVDGVTAGPERGTDAGLADQSAAAPSGQPRVRDERVRRRGARPALAAHGPQLDVAAGGGGRGGHRETGRSRVGRVRGGRERGRDHRPGAESESH